MGDVVRLLVLLAASVAAYIGWRLYSYPGGWSYAFGDEHAADRKDLDAARGQVRALAREMRKELNDAHTRIHREKARRRERARNIERKIDELRESGRGQQVARFGGLTVHQHTVLKGEREYPLAGLKIRLETTQHHYFIYLTESNGDACYESYSCADYAEDDVRSFVMQLEHAAAEENAFRSRMAVLITQNQEEVAQVRADTHAEEEARRHLAEVTERHGQDPRRKATHTELEAARDRWHKLSGRRPR